MQLFSSQYGRYVSLFLFYTLPQNYFQHIFQLYLSSIHLYRKFRKDICLFKQYRTVLSFQMIQPHLHFAVVILWCLKMKGKWVELSCKGPFMHAGLTVTYRKLRCRWRNGWKCSVVKILSNKGLHCIYWVFMCKKPLQKLSDCSSSTFLCWQATRTFLHQANSPDLALIYYKDTILSCWSSYNQHENVLSLLWLGHYIISYIILFYEEKCSGFRTWQ